MSLTIDDMHLSPVMEGHAQKLERAFPGVIRWTSGRRSYHEQARAMAVNHLQDPQAYLMRSYVHAAEFLNAIALAPTADSVDEITEVLYDIMENDPGLIASPHLLGNAVDLRPLEDAGGLPTTVGQDVITWINACQDTVDFRTREGRLRRWHWAVTPSYAV